MPTAIRGVCVAIVDDPLYAIGSSGAVGSGTAKYPISGPPYDTNEQYTPAGYTPVPSQEPTSTPEPQTEPLPAGLVA